MRRDHRQAISLRNKQRARRIDARRLRKVILLCLREVLQLDSFDIGVQIVHAAEMTKINEQYLRHRGSTDVITFDYRHTNGTDTLSRLSGFLSPIGGEGWGEGAARTAIHGDIYVCIDEAIAQAKRFRTSWQEEILRYILHGILHLLGYDDRTAAQRTKMKREEDKLMTRVGGL